VSVNPAVIFTLKNRSDELNDDIISAYFIEVSSKEDSAKFSRWL
jgi:hypothetical protein